jgi:hypothetical protein
VQTAARTITTSGIQNNHCQLSCSTTAAPATMPTAAPMPRIADMIRALRQVADS